jgi:hypothetical protein
MTIPSTGITPEVIRGVMPPYTLSTDLLEATFRAIPAPPADATTAWRHARVARPVREIGGLMPADAPQARIAAQILIFREAADDTVAGSDVPGLTVEQLCRLRHTAADPARLGATLGRTLGRQQALPASWKLAIVQARVARRQAVRLARAAQSEKFDKDPIPSRLPAPPRKRRERQGERALARVAAALAPWKLATAQARIARRQAMHPARAAQTEKSDQDPIPSRPRHSRPDGATVRPGAGRQATHPARAAQTEKSDQDPIPSRPRHSRPRWCHSAAGRRAAPRRDARAGRAP